MPVIKCSRCGSTTNTAIADCWRGESFDPTSAARCYGAMEGDRIVKGCAWNDPNADMFKIQYVAGLIMKQPWEKKE